MVTRALPRTAGAGPPRDRTCFLLRSRERLSSAFEDDWTLSEAMPSEEEISRVRRLSNRVKADLGDLSDQERTQIEEAGAAAAQ